MTDHTAWGHRRSEVCTASPELSDNLISSTLDTLLFRRMWLPMRARLILPCSRNILVQGNAEMTAEEKTRDE